MDVERADERRKTTITTIRIPTCFSFPPEIFSARCNSARRFRRLLVTPSVLSAYIDLMAATAAANLWVFRLDLRTLCSGTRMIFHQLHVNTRLRERDRVNSDLFARTARLLIVFARRPCFIVGAFPTRPPGKHPHATFVRVVVVVISCDCPRVHRADCCATKLQAQVPLSGNQRRRGELPGRQASRRAGRQVVR